MRPSTFPDFPCGAGEGTEPYRVHSRRTISASVRTFQTAAAPSLRRVRVLYSAVMSRLQLPPEASSELHAALAAIDAGDRAAAVGAARVLANDSGRLPRFAGIRLLYLLRLYQEALDSLQAWLHSHSQDDYARRLHYSLLKRLRFEEEAGAALEELLRRGDDLRVHEAAVLHYRGMGRARAALEHLEPVLRAKPDAGHRYRAQLRLAVDARDPTLVRSAARHALELDPQRWPEVVDELFEVGLFDAIEAEAKKHSATAEGGAVLAQIALYRGAWREAYELASNSAVQDPGSERATTVMVGAAVMAGELDRAADILENGSGELGPTLRTWLGELLLRRGDLEAARRELTRVQNEVRDYFAAKLLSVLVKGELDREQWVTISAYDGLLEGQLQALGIELRVEKGLVDANELRAAAADALRRLAGNRSPFPSVLREGKLECVRIPASARHRVSEVQHSVRWIGLKRVKEEIAAELARIGPHPIAECYEAEVDLWCGDYGVARGKFERILAAARQTTWGWIGLGASHVLLGNPSEGLRILDEGVKVMGWRGATLPVYRGEALFRLGRLDEAADELAEACRTQPGRVAAWLLRVLVEHGRGSTTERDAAFAHLEDAAPALLSDAARIAGVGGWWPARPAFETQLRVTEQALVLMRGNRSSSCPFWLAPETETVRSIVLHRPVTTPSWEAEEMRLLSVLLSSFA